MCAPVRSFANGHRLGMKLGRLVVTRRVARSRSVRGRAAKRQDALALGGNAAKGSPAASLRHGRHRSHHRCSRAHGADPLCNPMLQQRTAGRGKTRRCGNRPTNRHDHADRGSDNLVGSARCSRWQAGRSRRRGTGRIGHPFLRRSVRRRVANRPSGNASRNEASIP
jgi:hypothetical protein